MEMEMEMERKMKLDSNRSSRRLLPSGLVRLLLGLGLGVAIAAEGWSAEAPEAEIEKALSLLPRIEKPWGWGDSPTDLSAGVYRGVHAQEVVLRNGLIERVIRILPNAATVALDDLRTGQALVRGVKPEAILRIDGKDHAVGGLTGQPDYAYLQRDWIDGLRADPAALRCTGFPTGKTEARFPWKRKRYSADLPWPPPGAALTLRFEPPRGDLGGLEVLVHYEILDGIALVSKWLTIVNGTGRAIRLDSVTCECLAVVESESSVEDPGHWEEGPLHVETDYAFHGSEPYGAQKAVHWVPDPQYTTQVNYLLRTPVLLECRPPLGPGVTLAPGETFESVRVFELAFDSMDKEARGLAVRRMYRTIAPWVTENPIIMHARSAAPEAVRSAIDQCANVGFEMVILTFGSGLDMESEDPAVIERFRALVDYAHSRGVELGGYSLLASRRVSDEDDVIHPETGKPGGAIFGNSPCLLSRWGTDYFRRLQAFIEKTGMDILEHDGSYPGDVCASTKHPGHAGLDDSQWLQWRKITEFYRWCRARGVYLNVPDWYFLQGANKTAMGYREVNWSLPRDRQIILGRQNIYDGTWFKTPSMGWMFVPLVEYQGGGAAATLEPLREHLDAYGQHLAQNFSSGVQACYRGPRLYDSDETRAVVKRWVDFYRKYRPILDADIVHLRRPDGRDLDGILHVGARLSPRAMAILHNPLGVPLRRTVLLPLREAALGAAARVRIGEGEAREVKLDRDARASVEVEVPAHGLVWITIDR